MDTLSRFESAVDRVPEGEAGFAVSPAQIDLFTAMETANVDQSIETLDLDPHLGELVESFENLVVEFPKSVEDSLCVRVKRRHLFGGGQLRLDSRLTELVDQQVHLFAIGTNTTEDAFQKGDERVGLSDVE